YFVYFALLPLVIVAAVEAWRRRPPLTRTAAHALMALTIAAAALVPIARVYTWVRADREFTRTSVEIEAFSADVGDYFRGHHLVRLWRGAPHGDGEHQLFPGAVALVLASCGLVSGGRRRTPDVVPYAAVATAAFVLSLGPRPTAWGHAVPFPGPYRLLLAVVPGLDGLRAVARLAIVFVLALSVIAAYGAIAVL